MLRIDSHQHFWKYDPLNYDWITDEMSCIRKDFLPGDLKPILEENGFDGCIAVQAQQTEAENTFLLDHAEKFDFIKGVVGWVDLQSKNLEERLDYFKEFKKLKGFRHVLQGEAKRDLMLTADFKKGIGMLEQFGFTYDILIFPDQLGFAKDLVASFAKQKFVIDHLAKPYIKRKDIRQWKKDMEALISHDNVYCKISGMVTEADWKNWQKTDFYPYLDVIVNSFGMERIMYGSDWPVCLVAASYEEELDIVKNYFSSFSKQEQGLFFGGNAAQFYNLN